jgi:hypothetical protein
LLCSVKRVNISRGYKIVDVYEPNIGASKFIKQILTDPKREIYKTTVIRELNSPL